MEEDEGSRKGHADGVELHSVTTRVCQSLRTDQLPLLSVSTTVGHNGGIGDE